ncbi:MAG: hypothetical protein ABIH03_06900, partial [Pseudomonadota bacterium]
SHRTTEVKPAVEDRYIVELDGRSYTWNGSAWYETKTFLRPPAAIVSRLNRQLQDRLAQSDEAVTDIQELLSRAKIARDAKQLKRSERLLSRALKLRPGHEGALAILCSLLRDVGAPERALAETHAFSGLGYPPLLTSRAAAYCDLGQWEEAKREIARVLAVPGKDKGEAFSVVHRIKAARPDLYDLDR